MLEIPEPNPFLCFSLCALHVLRVYNLKACSPPAAREATEIAGPRLFVRGS